MSLITLSFDLNYSSGSPISLESVFVFFKLRLLALSLHLFARLLSTATSTCKSLFVLACLVISCNVITRALSWTGLNIFAPIQSLCPFYPLPYSEPFPQPSKLAIFLSPLYRFSRESLSSYALFLITIVSLTVLLFLHRHYLLALICLTLGSLPSLFYLLFCKATAGSCYNLEVQHYRRLLWILHSNSQQRFLPALKSHHLRYISSIFSHDFIYLSLLTVPLLLITLYISQSNSPSLSMAYMYPSTSWPGKLLLPTIMLFLVHNTFLALLAYYLTQLILSHLCSSSLSPPFPSSPIPYTPTTYAQDSCLYSLSPLRLSFL